MEIFIIVTLVVLIIYFFIKASNLSAENKKSKDQVVNLTHDLNEARINSTKIQSENVNL